MRAGDNLYTNSLVALDADTGKLKWYFQFTPHDTHDWDSVEDPVLIDMMVKGRKVKAVVQANRNGFFYALDRTNGQFLHAAPFTKITWAKGIDTKGRPMVVPGLDPSERGNVKVCPGLGGGHTWHALLIARRRNSSTSIRPTAARCSIATSRNFMKASGTRRVPTTAIPSEPAAAPCWLLTPRLARRAGASKW